MYSVRIRDHIMIAHSFNDPAFGDAMRLHGATYVVDVTFYAHKLDEHNMVIDIGKTSEMLKSVLDKLRYRNLDEVDEFLGKLTTTEFMAFYIHKQIKETCSRFFRGKIGVTLSESHVAWASYEE